jgi:hypothetical protein
VDRIAIAGELATLALVDPATPRTIVPLAEAPALARAHVAFYDASYFADKREGPTKKYRRLLAEPQPELARDALEAATFGPTTVALESCLRTHTPAGAHEGSSFTRLVFRNAIDFHARFDGARVHITRDDAALTRAATEVEDTWRAAMGELPEHRGALLYMTKYFTPHTAGEPHFFVKPWALFGTPPGTGLAIDGCHGAGYDVLRGVIRSDRFGTAPAVFGMWGSGAEIHVPHGRVLTRMIPFAHDQQSLAPQWHAPLPTAATE